MASLIPGAQIDQGYGCGISDRDLIFSGNGYVAVAKPLRRISTYPSDCVAIRVMAGYLRWDNEDASFEKLLSVEPRGDLSLGSENSSLKYIGLTFKASILVNTFRHKILVPKASLHKPITYRV
jgi:hypothetical protein